MGKRKSSKDSYYESAWAELDFLDSRWGQVLSDIPKVVEEGVPDYTKYGLTEEITRTTVRRCINLTRNGELEVQVLRTS